MEYADYHHAMAQHAAALSNNNQLHPAMAQIPMLSAAGLNLTVMGTGLTAQPSHQLHGQVQGHHQIMYQNVQPAQNTHVTHHQQQQQQHQTSNHHSSSNHHNNPGSQASLTVGNASHGNQGGGHGKNSKKKPKVNKDGVPAPKRATTAYINFTQWYREELKKAGRPIPKIGEFGKECASKWNAMQDEEKKPFLDVAARDRDRYKREMQVFKPARDINKPKRPGTAFMLFMGDFRKEMQGKEPEGGVAALAKLGGERWRNMSDEEKRPYVERQNEEKIRYEAAMEDYRRKANEDAALEPSASPKDGTCDGSSDGDSDRKSSSPQNGSKSKNLTPGTVIQIPASLAFAQPGQVFSLSTSSSGSPIVLADGNLYTNTANNFSLHSQYPWQ